ncbi:GlcG/HbpS family heme-binding protein [Rugamonas apoptosis]|uniref:Heme-binding protein n=1 Tax=Rugamonas apoptosis TaxID=2758570 RepID=A0A7W2FDN5_9BURK|nr:heme-binding protein [Rugamonas apoptosis]MBA5689818.1 heme-binding protein [Rugamonas apoptosis]
MSRTSAYFLAAGLLWAALPATPVFAQQPGYGAPISLDLAKRAAAGAVAEAKRLKLAVAVAVVDTHGTPVYLEVLDDTMTASPNFAFQKARTAATLRRPSKALEEGIAGGRNALLSLPDLLMLEGGEPVLLNGKLVGAIGVSGGTSGQDGQIARAGVEAGK